MPESLLESGTDKERERDEKLWLRTKGRTERRKVLYRKHFPDAGTTLNGL